MSVQALQAVLCAVALARVRRHVRDRSCCMWSLMCAILQKRSAVTLLETTFVTNDGRLRAEEPIALKSEQRIEQHKIFGQDHIHH